MAEKYRTIEVDVQYTYDSPLAGGLMRAVRNSVLHDGKLVIEKEGDYFNIILYHGTEPIATSSLDFFYHENFIDGDKKGPVYLNVDLSDLREELYSRFPGERHRHR